MKPKTPHQPTRILKPLFPDEQKILLMAQRHRAEYWRRMKRFHDHCRNAKRTLLVAACAAGLFVGTTNGHTADTPAVSAPALFNEANAAQRAGHLGPAILGYERARLLAPRDQAITQNLQVAREKAGVSAPGIATWQRPAHWLSFNSLAVLASISLLLLGFLVFGTRLIPTTLRSLARGTATTFAFTALLAVSAIATRWPELDRAVIVGAQPTAHLAPAASSAGALGLKPGDIVTAGREHGDFVLVRSRDQRSGWVAKADVERIIPATANPSPM